MVELVAQARRWSARLSPPNSAPFCCCRARRNDLEALTRQMIEMRAEVTVGRASQCLKSGEVDRAAIYCRKSEIKLSLPHEQSIPSARRILGPPFRRRFRDKSARKNLLLKISCNLLISLD
jgi:hypothetical protein